ncbi:MAG: phosphodiester glycosidase family protein [Cocleimonas sp.]|nr:phosphodiester glycosidase family protein [Cocleimonas sp.]
MIRRACCLLSILWFSINAKAKNIEDDGLIIAEFKGTFEYLYFPKNPPSLNKIAKKYGYQYILNASFFEGWRGKAQHAGWLKIRGQTYASIKKDRQLTHVAVLDQKGQLTFFDYRSFKSSDNKNTIEFQTGPLILDKNQVTNQYINGSFNGKGRYRRTLLGVTENGNKYFIIATLPTTLNDLANKLLKKPIFQDHKLSVINLDGGPSVALYSRDNPEMNFNTRSKLPLLLVK